MLTFIARADKENLFELVLIAIFFYSAKETLKGFITLRYCNELESSGFLGPTNLGLNADYAVYLSYDFEKII